MMMARPKAISFFLWYLARKGTRSPIAIDLTRLAWLIDLFRFVIYFRMAKFINLWIILNLIIKSRKKEGWKININEKVTR